MKKMNKTPVDATVTYSKGPSIDPLSLYSSTKSVHHDCKVPIRPVHHTAAGETGFGRNAVPTGGPGLDDDPQARNTSWSHSKLCMGSSLLGERADKAQEEDGDFAAALALARAKRHKTGYQVNNHHTLTDDAYIIEKEPILLVKQKMGPKDPVARENNYTGPTPMSTTTGVGYVRHQAADPNAMDEAEVDLYGKRDIFCGALRNTQATVMFQPHDGWAPVSEMKTQFGNNHAGAEEDRDICPQTGVRLLHPDEIPAPIGPQGLLGMGIPVVDRIRNLLWMSAGPAGFRGLTRTLRMIEDKPGKKLSREEIAGVLTSFGVQLETWEFDEMVRFFDRDRSGGIAIAHFIASIRGPMSDARRKLVRQAYTVLDTMGDESITMQEIADCHDVNHHPDVLACLRTKDEVWEEFIGGWDKDGDDEVSFADFCDYYDDVSACIDGDEYFELLMRNCWHLSGGKGQGACTTNKKVAVTHSDGSETIHVLKNDLRIGPNDKALMVRNLINQGVTDIQDVKMVNLIELGPLQKAVQDNIHKQVFADRKFRQNLISNGGNGIRDLYSKPLAPGKEHTMKIKDPVEYSVYKSCDPMQTSYGANFNSVANPFTVSLAEVNATNPGALQHRADPQSLTKLATGHPAKTTYYGGYATNNMAAKELDRAECANPRKLNLKQASVSRVSKKLEMEGDVRMSMTKSDYRDQFKVPIPTGNVAGLRKSVNGYSHAHSDKCFLEPDSVEKVREKPVALKKLGIPAVDAVRQKLYDRGGRGGFRGLTRILRIMDDNGNRSLSRDELKSGLLTYGLVQTEKEMNDLMNVFDRDRSGEVSISEFVRLLRGPLPERRKQLIRMAFNMLDTNGNGKVTFAELFNIYSVEGHPDVVSKRMTPNQVMQEFTTSWDKDGNQIITFDEFMDYYLDISAGIDNDDYFELMMKNCWRLPASPKFR